MNVIQRMTQGCEKDCRINSGMSTMPLLGWTPVYDKNGALISRDPNWTTTHYVCAVCDRSWTVRARDGADSIIDEIIVPEPILEGDAA